MLIKTTTATALAATMLISFDASAPAFADPTTAIEQHGCFNEADVDNRGNNYSGLYQDGCRNAASAHTDGNRIGQVFAQEGDGNIVESDVTGGGHNFGVHQKANRAVLRAKISGRDHGVAVYQTTDDSSIYLNVEGKGSKIVIRR